MSTWYILFQNNWVRTLQKNWKGDKDDFGEAVVEQGFSVNKNLWQVNVTEASIVAQHMIYDHMISNNLQPQTLWITKGLLQSVGAARSRYDENLNEKRKDKILNEQRKHESIQKDIFSVMNVKKDLEKMCATLTNDFESLMEKAEKLGDIAYVVEANGLKCKRSEKIEEIKKLEETLECLEKKKKNT